RPDWTPQGSVLRGMACCPRCAQRRSPRRVSKEGGNKMFNETLKSFVDSGKIVRYAWARETNWTAAEEGPQAHWKIYVRRGPDGLNTDGLRSALGNMSFYIYDEDIGVAIHRITDGALVFKHDAENGRY